MTYRKARDEIRTNDPKFVKRKAETYMQATLYVYLHFDSIVLEKHKPVSTDLHCMQWKHLLSGKTVILF